MDKQPTATPTTGDVEARIKELRQFTASRGNHDTMCGVFMEDGPCGCYVQAIIWLLDNLDAAQRELASLERRLQWTAKEAARHSNARQDAEELLDRWLTSGEGAGTALWNDTEKALSGATVTGDVKVYKPCPKCGHSEVLHEAKAYWCRAPGGSMYCGCEQKPVPQRTEEARG